jgi:hypothetical protein
MMPYEFLKGGVAFIFSTCIQVEKLTPHFPPPTLICSEPVEPSNRRRPLCDLRDLSAALKLSACAYFRAQRV